MRKAEIDKNTRLSIRRKAYRIYCPIVWTLSLVDIVERVELDWTGEIDETLKKVRKKKPVQKIKNFTRRRRSRLSNWNSFTDWFGGCSIAPLKYKIKSLVFSSSSIEIYQSILGSPFVGTMSWPTSLINRGWGEGVDNGIAVCPRKRLEEVIGQWEQKDEEWQSYLMNHWMASRKKFRTVSNVIITVRRTTMMAMIIWMSLDDPKERFH